jgi:hypothetical protein
MQVDRGDARLLEPVTRRISVCAFRVANALGDGKPAMSPPEPGRQNHPLHQPASRYIRLKGRLLPRPRTEPPIPNKTAQRVVGKRDSPLR